MKILIVAVYFPPRNSIASYRPYSWAKFWSLAGHDVTVLTAEYPVTEDGLDYDLSSFRVIRVKDAVPGRRAFISASRAEDGEKGHFGRKLRTRLLGTAKRWYDRHIEPTGIITGMNFPNLWDVWAKRAVKAVKDECFDAVVSTASPYSVHRIGLYLKRHGKSGKWICDWRDLWTRGHFCTGLRIFQKHQTKLERKFHDNADLITTVSDGLKKELEAITDTPVETVYNGFLRDEFERTAARPRRLNGKFTVSYLGSVYRGLQNLDLFFRAINELHEAGEVSPDSLRIQFAGSTGHEYVQELVEKYALDAFCVHLSNVPHQDALQMEYDSDAVLFFDCDRNGQKGILSGKIFEYLFLARDIICVSFSEHANVGGLLRDSNAGCVFYGGTAPLKSYILNRMKNRAPVREKDFSVIEKYDRQKQAERLLELMS